MATEMGRMPFFYNQEGRLVQVDYALQAVSRGSTTLGLKTKDFALLSSQVKPTRPLMEPAEKVFVVDEHIGATGSGYIGDVTTLLDQLRVAAQRHRLVYDEPVDVGTLSRNLSEYLHEFTMYAVRPFGASVVIACVDALGVQLIQVELRAFHVPRNRAVELPVELRLDRCRESLMSEIPFPKHLEDRPLHRFILCPANLDSPLSLRVQRQYFLFDGAQGEDEHYSDK